MRVLGVFFKEVGPADFLFGYETWVITPRTGQSMGGFSIGWTSGSQESNYRGYRTEVGSTPLWRK